MYAVAMLTIVVSMVMEFGSKIAHSTYTKTQFHISKCSLAMM